MHLVLPHVGSITLIYVHKNAFYGNNNNEKHQRQLMYEIIIIYVHNDWFKLTEQ